MLKAQEKSTRLWLTTQKLKAYLRSAPFRAEGVSLPVYVPAKPVARVMSPDPIPQTQRQIIHPEPIKEDPRAWVDLPLISPSGRVDLLVLVGVPTREALAQKVALTETEKEALFNWMKAINVRDFGVKAFPWQDKTVSLTYKESKNWLNRLLEQTKAQYILTLGEETLSFFTGYPALLEFTHGVDFPFTLGEQTIPILPTYSLSQVSHDPKLKVVVWRDLKRVLGIIRHESL